MIPVKPSNSPFNEEQWQAIHQKGGNILISASAGSGKTTVLIERILNHINSGYAEVDEMLVVTFTEAAAGEMKERLETRLKAAVTESTGEEQANILEQLRKVKSSDIRTLHSFCLRVIQQFFYLKDLNPNFDLVTDNTQLLMIQERVWEDLVAEVMEDKTTRNKYQQLLNIFGSGRSDEPLFEIVLSIYRFAMSHPNPDQWLETASKQYANFDAFLESELYAATLKPQLLATCFSASQLLTEAQEILAGCQNDIIEKYAPVLDNDQEMTSSLYEAFHQNEVARAIQIVQAFTFDKWPNNSKKNDDYDAINEMKGLRDQAKKMIEKDILSVFPYSFDSQAEIESRVFPILESLIALSKRYMTDLADYKSQMEIIDYTDLEHMTLDLLTIQNPETGERVASPAAEFYQRQFEEVLVDEYQDINDIQGAILSWLSRERVADQPGNLFMVGDVKQSIYGFRMAEPRLFLERYQAYEADPNNHLILLNRNYRSRPEVLQFTNYIFERIMDEKVAEMDYGLNEFLIPGNGEFIEQASVSQLKTQLLVNVSEDTSEEDDELSELTGLEGEIHIIAQDMMRRVKTKELIYDKKLGNFRPIEFKDMTILSSAKNSFIQIQQIFTQYNIPILSQKIESYFQRQEVQIILALLRIIDNPMQDIPLVAVLRSYFVGLTDEELSQIRIHHKKGDFYEAVLDFVEAEWVDEVSQQLKEKLVDFLSQINKWRSQVQTEPIVDVIWQIYLETNFLDYVAGLSNGNQRQANLHALYQRAADFSGGQFKSLSGFVHYIEQVMQSEQDLAEPVLIDADQNVVRLMTVHASKGLEFPVVYLINTNKKFNLMDTRAKVMMSKNHGISSDYYDSEHHVRYYSLIKKAMKIEQEKRLKAEEMRKLYVAFTRSEQQLIIVGTIKTEEKWEEGTEQVREMTSNQPLLANDYLRQSADTWLKWMMQAIAVNRPEKGQSGVSVDDIDIHFIDQSLIQQQMPIPSYQNQFDNYLNELITAVRDPRTPDIKGLQTVEQLMSASYRFELSSHTSSYQSVSELKRLYEEPRIEKLSYFADRRPNQEAPQTSLSEGIQGIRYTEDTFNEPQFINQQQIQTTDRGTLTHYVLQLLDFSSFKEADLESIYQSQIETLLKTRQITDSDLKIINQNHILNFLSSKLGQLLIQHQEKLKKEMAFSYSIPAQKLFKRQLQKEQLTELADNQLLVHGVIDGYLEFDDHIVMLDYKTNQYRAYGAYSKQEQIASLEETYRFQMSLYREALSLAKNKPVSNVYLVLLDFEEVVDMTDFVSFKA
ncbi:helicase-exonuclease AddAB subunit AddA [Aerococcaceae bacterium DSM 111022]|nr:helicase-exonuclease AddAB subunit AddA [Aerococcaceae bacterium DSM 111022]